MHKTYKANNPETIERIVKEASLTKSRKSMNHRLSRYQLKELLLYLIEIKRINFQLVEKLNKLSKETNAGKIKNT